MNRGNKNTGRRSARGSFKTNKTKGDFQEKRSKPTNPKPEKKKPAEGKDSDTMRLNRFLAHSGICSRREAEKFIESGCVTVNGKVVTNLATKVNPQDDVRFNGASLNPQRKVYVLLNKPKDYVTTLDDPNAKKIVMDLVSNACKERIYPVGRLDRATTGLLLFTNDGDLAEKLTHPKNNKKKIYQITLDRNVTRADLEQMLDGFELEDGFIQADAVDYVEGEDKKTIGVEIHSGRNRIVRRMFEHFGYKVRKLDRVYFAGLTKKNLPRGKFRHLSHQEVITLKRGLYE